MRFAAILLVLVAGCTVSPSSTSHVRSPSPVASAVASPGAPSPKSYAVLVKDFLGQGDGDYTISIVSTDGRLAASATAHRRTRFVQVGNLSTSRTSVYYLDGDADIHFLRPDGGTGTATHVVLGPHQVAAFAVSPDDRRIAVSILDYTRYPVSTNLYVEDLTGGGNHVELFSLPTVLAWPAGWHNGRLVMALGLNQRPQNSWEGFMRGYGYHVADAGSGDTIFSLCDGVFSFVPESPAGTVCARKPTTSVVSWAGDSRTIAPDGECAIWGPLSPSGVMASSIMNTPVGSCTGGNSLFLIGANGVRIAKGLGLNGTPDGWIDESHLVVSRYTSPDWIRTVVDVTTGVSSAIQASGFFAAALPGGL